MADTTDSPKKKPMVIEGYQVYSSEGTVKPVFSDHIRKSIFLTDDCSLLHGSSAEMRHESSAESSFLHYFHSAISNHLSRYQKKR